MPKSRITKRSVDSLRPSRTDIFMWDEDLSGFGVRVYPSGQKTYVVQYRIRGLGRRGNARRIALGEHGELTPDEARKLARRELGKVAQGSDPAGDRTARRQADSVKDLGVRYLEYVENKRKQTTAREYKRLWRKHVVPVIGSKPIGEVTLVDVRRLHSKLSATPYVANRVVAMLGSFFRYAQREGARLGENPVRGVELNKEHPRERFLTPAEFRKLGDALSRAETAGLPPAPEHRKEPEDETTAKHRPKSADTPIKANPFAVAAIRLLALTGCRENEILSLTWDAVDFDRGYLRLSDTKTGKSNRPLSQSAAAILHSIPRIDGNPFVLPGAILGEHLKQIARVWCAVRHAAGLADVRLHDLRHSYASVPATSGESLLIVRSLLGHKRVATTERYAHLGDDPVKRAADQAGRNIASWLSGATSKEE